jgi:Putative Ig domain/Dockerin type I domain
MMGMKSQRHMRESKTRNQKWRSVETLERRMMLTADWQNPSNPWDVDGNDGPESVTPLDALLVINELSRRDVSAPETGELPDLGPEDGSPPPFVDVNGDNLVSPLDAIMVINRLGSDGLGNSSFTSTRATDTVMAGTSAANFVVTSDTLVNTVVSRSQASPDLASASDGRSVVVWSSFDQDGQSWGVFGQRYNAIGEKVGGEFQVNTFTKSSQRDAAVAMAPTGEFVIVWQSLGEDGSAWGVYGQRFDANGVRQGGEFRINETTKGHQWHPDVAFLSNGGFVVTWDGRGHGDRDGVFSRVYAANGTATGGETLVNTTTSGFQTDPAVASLGMDGSFVIAWHGKGTGDHLGVFMKRSGQSSEVRVNPERHGTQSHAAIAGNVAGDIVVSYQEFPETSGGVGIRAVKFPNNAAATGVIHVNQTGAGLQHGPAVAFLNEGAFAVAWYGKGGGDGFGIQQRRFSSSGVPATDESLANTTTKGIQERPAIANVAGDFVVVWQGKGEGDKHGIFARLFDVPNSGNLAPTLDQPIADQQINAGSAFNLNIASAFSDRDPLDVLTFTATPPAGGSLPAWLQFNGSTGQFSGTPANGDVGNFQVLVRATDPAGASVSDTFQIMVNAVNTPPQLVSPIPDQSASVGTPFTFDVTTFFTDTDALSFTTSTLPTWLTFNSATQVFSGTPTAADVSSPNITVTATDTGGLTVSDTFAINVTQGNRAPIVSTPIPNQAIQVGSPLSLVVASSFSDPDADTLAFTATRSNGTALPSWLTFTASTATFSGTPSAADVGTVSITVTARDPGNLSVTDTFDIVVSATGNTAPVVNDQIFNVLRTAATGAIVGTVLATDPNNDALTFAITAGNGAGAFALNATTGQITVANSTALAAIVGDAVLTVTVSDDGTPSLNDTATITILISDSPLVVQYSVGFLDSQNNPITSIVAGGTFQFVVFVQDIRSTPTGAFSAFVDVNFPAALVSTNGSIVHSTTYGAGTSGSLGTPGLIDEVGGVDGVAAIGGARFELFRVPMVAAQTAGQADFTLDPADNVSAHPTTVFGDDDAIPSDRIRFSGASLTITPANTGRAASGSATGNWGMGSTLNVGLGVEDMLFPSTAIPPAPASRLPNVSAARRMGELPSVALSERPSSDKKGVDHDVRDSLFAVGF